MQARKLAKKLGEAAEAAQKEDSLEHVDIILSQVSAKGPWGLTISVRK